MAKLDLGVMILGMALLGTGLWLAVAPGIGLSAVGMVLIITCIIPRLRRG